MVITSPSQARHVLAYVMNNWRRHQEDRDSVARAWRIDWYSSAPVFPGWREYGEAPFLWPWPAHYDPLLVYRPRTWLLREGWKQHGLISCHEVPGPGR